MSEFNAKPVKKLWNPNSFIVFSVLSSFLPAGIMYALNYGRSGYNKKKWTYLIGVIIFLPIALFLTSLLPDFLSKTVLTGINAVGGIYFMNTQEQLYKNHIKSGEKRASYFLPITISLLFTALILALYIIGS